MSVFFSSMAMVIGPTPPGTGVMAPATLVRVRVGVRVRVRVRVRVMVRVRVSVRVRVAARLAADAEVHRLGR